MPDALLAYAYECLKEIPHSTKRPEVFVFRDRYEHTVRVMKWCERLLERVPADREVVLAAAAAHDIGYAVCADGHARHSAEMAEKFLRAQGYDESFLQNVADLAAHHSDKYLPVYQMSNELIVLQDADCLDEIGAMTVLWDAMDEGGKLVQSYQKACRRIEASFRSISARNRVLKSEYGQALYAERIETLKRFIGQMKYELFLDD